MLLDHRLDLSRDRSVQGSTLSPRLLSLSPEGEPNLVPAQLPAQPGE
jgi:hypothetical protein